MPQLKLPKPNVVIMDLIGTAVKMGFIEKVLEPFVKSHVKGYLDAKWRDTKTQKDVKRLRIESRNITCATKIAAATAPEQEQKDSVVAYVTAAVDGGIQTSALLLFENNMWIYGIDLGKLETLIYSDVAIQLKKWKDLNIKLYVLSNGCVEFQKKILSKTNHGDLNLILDGCYDSSERQLRSDDRFLKFLAKLKATPDTTLFMTKDGMDARFAQRLSVKVLLVLTHRQNIDKLSESDKALPRIRSFNELEFCTSETMEAAAAAAPPPAGGAPPAGASKG